MSTLEIDGMDDELRRERLRLAKRGWGVVSVIERVERVLPWFWPWIEVNKFIEMRGWTITELPVVADAVAGLTEWEKLTSTAIVTTVTGKARLYDSLCKAVPGLRIIPGLKTNDALERFDDVDGWECIGETLSDMAERCGSDVVVLENESAVGAYGLGDEALDWHKFRTGIRSLPKELEIIWYPGITGNTDEKQDRMGDLCRVVVEEHANTRLVDRTYGRPAAVKWHWSKEARKRLVSIGAPTIPMLYVQGSKEYWQYHEIREALGHVADAPAAIIFPGAKDFKDAAIGIRKALEGATS